MQFGVWVWEHLLFILEAALLLPAAGIAWRAGRAEKFLHRVARHRMAPLAAAVLSLALRAAVLPVEPIPSPAVHDEFSYLLAADTFLHGRLANPTHPLWQHFETMQVDQQPAYVSMYPPAQGLVLAAGRLLTGIAFAGVWLSVGAMCAAICWALRGWFPPGWALFGGVIAAIRLGTFSYWADSYWGGAVAAIGGALLFGALPRLIRSSRPRDAVLAALGIAMMANSRPYEGLVLSIAVGLVALTQVRKLRLAVVLVPAAAVLAGAAALMGYYNWRAFGSPTTMPYTIQRSTYAVAPYFLFQTPRPAPAYRHQAMRDFYQGWELGYFESVRTPAGIAANVWRKTSESWSFYIGPALTLPLIALAWTWKSRRTRTLLALAAMVAVGNSVVPWFMPHYIAPATALIYALLIAGMRALRRWRPEVARAVPAVVVAMLAVRVGMAMTPIPFVLHYPMTWATTWSPALGREKIVERLQAAGGTHVVIVRYSPGHDPLREYVFNDADIDHARIVWARDMGVEKDAELVRYFSQRRKWLLEPDRDPPRLTPYE
jgi:hypothetical protein